MPATDSARPFATARFVLSFSVALLMLLVGWLAVRAVGPAEASRWPTVVMPSTPPAQAQTPTTPSLAPTTAAAPSAARSPSVKPVRAGSVRVQPKTRQPTAKPSPTTAPPARNDLAGTLSVGASWEQGYVAAVRVVNSGTTPLEWRVTVRHSAQENLRLLGVWGATGDQQGNRIVFTGGTLAPGASTTFGYQASKSGRGNAHPSGCSVVGGTCGVR